MYQDGGLNRAPCKSICTYCIHTHCGTVKLYVKVTKDILKSVWERRMEKAHKRKLWKYQNLDPRMPTREAEAATRWQRAESSR